MTKFKYDLTLEDATDIQFTNLAGANTGKVESDGNDLVLSNAVGDVLIGDGSSDVYIGDGTNNVDVLFEQSGSIKAEDGSSGVTLTLGSSDTTLVLGGSLSLANSVSAMSATGVNTVDIGTSAKPFKNIYAAHHVGGSSINYATSRGWVEDDNPLSSTQVGEFGGDFTRNGDAVENAVVWGLDPFGNKALLWKSFLNTSDDDDDGGWNKEIVIPANNNIGYLSYVYFKVDFTPDSANDGQVYLGAGQVAGETITLAGANNTNPYFLSTALSTFNNGGAATANRWYLAVGVLQAYNNSTTDNDTLAGVYDVESGEKVYSGGEYKMGNNTTGQKHRAYIYYDESTDANENAYFWNPGFHAIDGSEPKIQDLVKRQVYLDDNVKAAFGTGKDLEIYHDGSNSYVKESGTGDLILQGTNLKLKDGSGNNFLFGTNNSGLTLGHAGSTKLTTVSAGVEITGELQADSLDIDGNADISGTLDMSGNINLNNGANIILEADNVGGGGASIIAYPDAAGTNRIMLAADSDVVILSNRAANGTVQIRANTSTAGSGGEVTVATFEDDKVTISQDLDVTGNVLPGITIIKILPRDFIADDGGRPVQIDDTGSDRWIESDSTSPLYASVEIPPGFKATHVDIYGSATSAVTVYEADINVRTVTSKGTGNIGTQINITDVTSDATNYLLIELAQASGEQVNGGKVTIAKV